MNRTWRSRQAAASSWLVPPASVRQITSRWCGSTGSCASAASSTVRWSAAVPEPAFAGAQQPGQRLSGGVQEGQQRVEAEPVLVGRCGALFVRRRR